MLGLVPLINIPFDWLSIGFTRAILRRGCEDDAWSPFILGLIDFVIGLVLLVALAATLILALQTADAVALRFGGKAFIHVQSRLTHMGEHPWDPGNFWIYFTLFSTLIPSVINAVIGMISLSTYLITPLREWMVREIPRLDDHNLEGTRRKIVACLALHTGIGTFATGIVLWGAFASMQNLTPNVLPFFLRAAQSWARLLSPL